jgi:hypothetical protein
MLPDPAAATPRPQAPNGNWAGTGSGFTGRIDHHGKGRPFKDGFSAAAAATKEATTDAVDAASDVAEGRGNEVGWGSRRAPAFPDSLPRHPRASVAGTPQRLACHVARCH